MSKTVLYIGRSGDGKTTGARTLNPSTTFIIQCSPGGKELPWRGSESQYKICDKSNPEGNLVITNLHKRIVEWLDYINDRRPEIRDIVIDDNTFVSSLELLRRTKETTWDKFSDIAANFIDMINKSKTLRSDLIVHILHHSVTEGDGILEPYHHRAQSYGKLIDEKLGSIEAQFTIVLRAAKEANEQGINYVFYTKDANSTVKTPLDMFGEAKIPNDIKLVSDTMREYYQ